MKFLVTLVVCLLFSSLVTAEDEAVITLTQDNFDDTVNAADIILVEFYAPWCGHCKHLAPEYEKAAQILKNDDPPIPLAKVDATVEADLAQRFEIRGYPTIKVFRKGTPSEYQGTREANGIVSYMRKQAGPASKPIDSAEALDKYKNNNEVVVVAFTDDASTLNEFNSAANSLRDDFAFAHITDAKLREASGHNGKIVLFRKADAKAIPFSSGDLTDFINANSIPIGGEMTASNAQRYKAAGLPILVTYIDVDYDKNAKRTLYYQRRLVKVGSEYEGKVIFAIASKGDFLRDPTSYGVSGDVPEYLTVIEDQSNRKYLFSQSFDTFNVENLKAFVENYLAGKLKAFIKSEPIPTSNDGPVTVVVGENFDEIVLDDTKNVLIEFYAPWCGHCKSLEPKYKELAEKFADDDSVVIAKIDATANDWPTDKFSVRGFPTIYFKPAGKNSEILSYTGSREVKDMKKFVKDNKQ